MTFAQNRLAIGIRQGRRRPDDVMRLGGGLNLVDPPLEIQPGQVIAAQNYEPGIRGGYRRAYGNERFDGQPRPSQASYTALSFGREQDSNGIVQGDHDIFEDLPDPGATVQGNTSSAQGELLHITAAAVTATELVSNGAFGTDATGWTPEGNNIAYVDNRAAAGNRLRVEYVDDADGAGTTITTVSGRTYFVKAELSLPIDATVQCQIDAYDGSSSLGSASHTVAAETKFVYFTFTATGATTTIRLRFTGTIAANDYFWADNVSAKLLQYDQADFADATGDANEADSTGNWGSSVGLSTFQSQGGTVNGSTYALEAVANAGAGRFFLDLDTYPGLTAGVRYTMQFDVRHSGSGGDWAVRLADTGAADATFETITDLDSTENTFATFRYTWTHSSDTRYLVFRENSGTNDGGVFLDNFKIRDAIDGELIIGRVTGGTYLDNEHLNDPTPNPSIGMAASTPSVDLKTDEEHLAMRVLAEEELRDDIAAVPGEGSILGVAFFDDVCYAWRNKTGGATAGAYKSTSSGWSEISLNNLIVFDTGSMTLSALTLMDTLGIGTTTASYKISGGTSGATAVVLRYQVLDGTWDVGDASGYFVVADVSGTWQVGEDIIFQSATIAAVDQLWESQTLRPSGRYDFRVNNFFGGTETEALYGCDGQNRMFEIVTEIGDGDFFMYAPIPIVQYNNEDPTDAFDDDGLPQVPDTPLFLAAHEDQLFAAFTGGSIQHSGPGDPRAWEFVTGAGELAVGGEPTGFIEEIDSALYIFTRDESYVLFGKTREEFNLVKFARETGAIPYSLQRIGESVFLDDRGFTNIRAVDAFGNFKANSFSKDIEPLLNKDLRLLLVDSHISRRHNLYRASFSNGLNLVLGYDGNRPTGWMPVNFGMNITCSFDAEDSTGQERTFVGADDGFVYELDVGRNFDGDPIEAYILPAYHYSGSPGRDKTYSRADFQIECDGQTTVHARQSLGRENQAIPQKTRPELIDVCCESTTLDLDDLGSLNANFGATLHHAVPLEGTAENISFRISTASNDEEPHTMHSILLQSSVRNMRRGKA